MLNTLIVEEHGTNAPRRLLFIHASATAAASATPLLISFARDFSPLTWYDAFRIAGFAHIALIVGASFVPMRSAPRRDDTVNTVNTANDEYRTAEPSPKDDRLALAAVCVATFAYVGVESAISLFVADHTTTELGFDAARAARTISAFWGGLLVGRLAIGFAPRPVGAGTTSALAAVAALLMLAFGSGVIGVPELAMASVGFFLGGVFPIMIGLAGIALPSSAGTAVGLAGGLGSLGGFVVPWLTGRLAHEHGLPFALSTLALWLIALVLATAFIKTRRRSSFPAP